MRVVLLIAGLGALAVGIYFVVRGRQSAERSAAFVQTTRVGRAESSAVASRARAEALSSAGARPYLPPRSVSGLDSGGDARASGAADTVRNTGDTAPVGV